MLGHLRETDHDNNKKIILQLIEKKCTLSKKENEIQRII